MREVFEYSVNISDLKTNLNEIEISIIKDFPQETELLRDLLKPISAKGEFIVIDAGDSSFNFSTTIKPVFKEAEKIVLFVSTLGEDSKRIIDSCKSDPFAYYVVDFLASQYADAMAEFMHQRVKEYAAQRSIGYSNRYSPGYCGWNVREQVKLFGYFPDSPCGVSLNDSFLMNPIKSVSGAIAIGNRVKYREYGCDKCKKQNCLYKSKL
jgi:hypothetical protein